MSSAIHAFAVDFDELKAAFGSKDEELLAQLLTRFATDIDWLDDDAENEFPSTATILRQLIFGEPYHKLAGFKSGFALEFLCWHLGEFLNNSEWFVRSKWFETVDAALKQAGVSPAVFTTMRLAFGVAPVPIPEPEYAPGIGHLTPDKIPVVAAVLDAADWSKVTDADVRTPIEQVRGWLKTCQETGRGLVCFYA